MIFRIAEQAQIFRFLNFHSWIGFNQRKHGSDILRRERTIHRLELATFNEEIKELFVSFEPAMRYLPSHGFQLISFGPRQQGYAGTFDSRVAHLYDFFIGDVWNQADAPG